jgi:serine/threonine-protein kinase RsbW
LPYRQIEVDGSSPLFERTGMFYKEFPSDYRQVRYFALLVVQKAPPEIQEVNLLQQQVGELLRNAIKHGNRCDQAKRVRVWYTYDVEFAHVIVEDEGEGFQEIENWNRFNRERIDCLNNQDIDRLADYVSYNPITAEGDDGGNALFAALEYWDDGFVFSDTRTAVAARKVFPHPRYGRLLHPARARRSSAVGVLGE